MNLGVRESVAQARGVLRLIQGKDVLPTLVICPSFTALAEVRKVTARSRIELGAQHVGPEREGAFTGEVSAQQLHDIGVQYVIVGHSERRKIFHEDDALIADQLKAAFTAGITPILCVGEDSAAQVMHALRHLVVPRRARLIVAYEPTWAIGTGNAAQPADVVTEHKLIRDALKDLKLDEQSQIVYGGSVDAENAYSFLREPEIEGVLVGGASLKIHEFQGIVGAACDVIAAQQL
ncbi:MAG: Triosephosphate isomerase [Candidatus Uhrbacteria bacterium GW2011_GWD2_52_7]|uniref:Triosephosphate isomerase n=1 Tax=Candidatus Uhrbacteria bacterium GW2011_GWD2_52_7 TaxID=1618989 RepID=A0A0G1XFG9_9BACT|nr:MAG: Triosephosphate isomerase [Candidatus Uhrbacteria bacterium GW2011_GWD2_52_7]